MDPTNLRKPMLQLPASHLLDGLNPEQSRAVTTISGPVLVVAGPGSGKTRVLAHRVAYLMAHEQVPPDRILAVTFTNKAAREMRDRIERLTGGGESARGLVMGTFHALGVRFLRQNPGVVADRLGILPNFLIYDDADQLDLVKRSLIEESLDQKQYAPRRMLSRISNQKAQLISPDEFAQEHVKTFDDEIVRRVYATYQRLLRKANAVDFDDLLALPLALFDAAPRLLEHYQERFLHVLVDEYQDTNRVQYILVSALSGKHRNLFVVGDPDQSIYAWRQADIRNILEFQQDFPEATVINLETNYRSTARIVDTADRVIRENRQRLERSLRTDNPEGEFVVLRELSDGHHEAQFIVAEIRRLVQSDKVTGDDIAVMYRTIAQSRLIEEAFRQSNIPYRIVGGVRFYDRKEVKDVLAVLRLLYNPADEVSLQRIVDNLPLGRGIGPKALEALRYWATLERLPVSEAFVALSTTGAQVAPELGGAGRAASTRLGAVLASLRGRVGSVALTGLFDQIVSETGYKATFAQDSEEEMQRWANVLELRSDLAKYDEVDPAQALPQYLEQVALVSDVDTMEDDSRGRVTLITLHSAKGLEFPVVFIAGVEEGLLPISRAIEAEWQNPAAIEEERRLFYVGITRAKHLLFLTYAGSRMLYGGYMPSAASRFLASLPQQHLRTVAARPTLARSPGRSLTERARNTSSSESSRPVVVVPAPPRKTFAAGDHVFHPRFGEGTVTETADRHDDQELAIDFARHGVKRLLASLANLDPLE